MPEPVKPIPAGYHAVTPYLIVRGAARAIDYYKQVFGATEVMRMAGPDGKIMHAEIRIGDSVIMMADEFPEMGAHSPETIGGTPVTILLYVPDVDAAFARALAAGAKQLRPIVDQFYGDRSGTVSDPFGHKWTIATHVEDVPPEEIERRAAAMHQMTAPKKNLKDVAKKMAGTVDAFARLYLPDKPVEKK